MTEFQIISAIENYVTSNEGVTNFPVSQEQIADEVNTLRIRLMSELDGARQFVRPWAGYTQTIPSLSTSQNTAGKRIVTLPRLYITAVGWPAITYIGGVDFESPYRVVNGNEHFAMKGSPYPNKPYAWVKDTGEIVLYNVNPEKVAVIGVFEKPSAFMDYGLTYNPETTEYPIPSSMIDTIIGKTAESYLRVMYRLIAQPNQQADLPQGGGRK